MDPSTGCIMITSTGKGGSSHCGTVSVAQQNVNNYMTIQPHGLVTRPYPKASDRAAPLVHSITQSNSRLNTCIGII